MLVLALVCLVTFRFIRRRREMYTGVCLCGCPRPHAHTTALTRIGGMVGLPPSCALLGVFAIHARVAFYGKCLYSLCAWLKY